MAISDDARAELRQGQRVRLTADRPGVPTGTEGLILMVTGMAWIRYRVRFDNGVELNLLDGRYLERA